MKIQLQSLREELVSPTKDLIAEVVTEYYGDLEFPPKTKSDLLVHYEKTGYLRDLDEFKGEYSIENGVFLVATEGENVIGCGGLRRLNNNDGELVRLWLKKQYRKHGTGRLIFDELIRAAKERGYTRVYLDTSNRCTDAVALFRRNGFVECKKYKESIGDLFLCRSLKDVASEK